MPESAGMPLSLALVGMLMFEGMLSAGAACAAGGAVSCDAWSVVLHAASDSVPMAASANSPRRMLLFWGLSSLGGPALFRGARLHRRE